MTMQPDLHTNVGRLRLKNPIMTASGTFGTGVEFKDLIDLNRLGAIIVKGLSLEPSCGNPPPRIIETPCGMLNAIGLENVGLKMFVDQKLPFLASLKSPTIVNIYGKTISEYVALAAQIEKIDDIDGIEVNISCPNVKAGGIAFGVDPEAAFELVHAVRAATGKPLMVKLSPNVSDIVKIAERVEKAGADSLSLINTLTGMAVDIKRRRPVLANITGGLSGPAIKPIALRMVWQVSQSVQIPVIGVGGIVTAEDALEFLITGAAAVQIGTANFVNPRATMDVLDGIAAFLKKEKISRITDIVGTLKI